MAEPACTAEIAVLSEEEYHTMVIFWLLILIVTASISISVDADLLTNNNSWTAPSVAAFSSLNVPPAIKRPSSLRHQQPDDDPGPTPSPVKHVVLIGGGHAHVQVVRALGACAGLRVTLVDPQASAHYSGMVPGCVAGRYGAGRAAIALDDLAARAGVAYVRGRAVGLAAPRGGDGDGARRVLVERAGDDGRVGESEWIPFDAVSIDVGSTTRDFASVPGARRYAIPTRPISELVHRIEQEEEVLKQQLDAGGMPNGARVVVVGAGAAGIELSLALRARWNGLLDSKLSVTLIDSNSALVPSENAACRAALEEVLDTYAIDVRHELVVDEITASHVHVSSGAERGAASEGKDAVPYTHCIWATGAEAHALSRELHRQCGLAISPRRGWIRVDRHLQSVSHPSVFAAGDCCEIVHEGRKSPPKAGVYAVRSGPILAENLLRFLGAGPDGAAAGLVAYRPQDEFLKLIMCGDGTALGFRFGIPLYGKWVWELKDHIDSMFVDSFNADTLPAHAQGGAKEKTDDDKEGGGDEGGSTSQDDAYEAGEAQLTAEEAATLLLRRDDGVDFRSAWRVLLDMMADEKYKREVLRRVGTPVVSGGGSDDSVK